MQPPPRHRCCARFADPQGQVPALPRQAGCSGHRTTRPPHAARASETGRNTVGSRQVIWGQLRAGFAINPHPDTLLEKEPRVWLCIYQNHFTTSEYIYGAIESFSDFFFLKEKPHPFRVDSASFKLRRFATLLSDSRAEEGSGQGRALYAMHQQRLSKSHESCVFPLPWRKVYF